MARMADCWSRMLIRFVLERNGHSTRTGLMKEPGMVWRCPRAATNRATGLPRSASRRFHRRRCRGPRESQLVRSLSIRSFVVRLGNAAASTACSFIRSPESSVMMRPWRMTRTRWASPSTSSKSEEMTTTPIPDAAISLRDRRLPFSIRHRHPASARPQSRRWAST